MSAEAFDLFVAEYRAEALRRATARVGPAAADDIVQEAMLAVWRRWGDLKDPAGYLYGACENAVKSEYRGRARRPVSLAELPEPAPRGGPDSTEPDGIASPELLAEMGLDGLPIECSLVAMLLAEGYSRQRVAELAGMTLPDVHTAVRQLRSRLRPRTTAPWPPDRESDGVVPAHKEVAAVVRRLPARQRSVLALSALGAAPVHIAALLEINGVDARVNLHHARKKIALLGDIGTARDIDNIVRQSFDPGELMYLLPDSPWRRKALTAADSTNELLGSALARVTAHAREPLRIAVVGRLRTGKSTLINQLIAGSPPEPRGGLEFSVVRPPEPLAPAPTPARPQDASGDGDRRRRAVERYLIHLAEAVTAGSCTLAEPVDDTFAMLDRYLRGQGHALSPAA